MSLGSTTSLWQMWLNWYSSPVNLVGSIVVGGLTMLYIWSCDEAAFTHGRRSKRNVLLVQVAGVLTSTALFTTLFVFWIGPMRHVRAYYQREDDRRARDSAPSTPVQNTSRPSSGYSGHEMQPQRTVCSSCGGRKTENCPNSACMGGRIETGLEGNAGWVPCPVCHATATIKCRACDGAGYR
jgi:hypothetical protein